MMIRKMSLSLLVVATIGAAVVVGRVNESPAPKMLAAARKLLEALPEDLRAKATFEFDDPQRIDWHYIPRERKGAVLKAMTKPQQALVMDLLRVGTSASGYRDAEHIMELEGILRDIENTERARLIRDPELYYVSVFGVPSEKGTWGWRIEGHHLSLNYVIRDGKVASETPAFMGANPAKVPSGPKKGYRALPGIEDVARRLYKSFDGAARKRATLAEKAPADVLTGTQNTAPKKLPLEGLSYGAMNSAQKKTLDRLISIYLDRYPDAVSEPLKKQISEAGIDRVHFGWYGPDEPGAPHAYRIQGPTFVIEYNNTQNDANHIHSVYRHHTGDFGIRAGAG